MARQTNPKRTLIQVPATGGAVVLVSATKTARYVEIQEVPPSNFDNNANPYAPQGLLYQLPDDNFTQSYGLVPGAVLLFGDLNWRSKPSIGQIKMTDPAGQAIAATPYVKVLSATATATQIELREFS